jgi:hypothetical protein
MRVIGLDPGKQTGVAVFDGGQLTRIFTTSPDRLMELLDDNKPDVVVFEDSRMQGHTWSRNTSPAGMRKIARNVGQIDAWCELILHLCAHRNIAVVSVSPKGKGRKIGASAFAMNTGWVARTNQHGRDAAMVAWRYRNGF